MEIERVHGSHHVVKKDDSFWVEFPDLEGCQSFGDSLAEIMELAQEALGLYLAGKLNNNDEAEKRNLNFSLILQKAILEEIQR